MKHRSLILAALATLIGSPAGASAGFSLGAAGGFAVLGGSAVTNTGGTLVDGGNVGVSASTTISGFPGGVLASPYTFHAEDGLTTRAHADLVLAYAAAAAMASNRDLTGQDLGGLVLTPGVYKFSSSAQLTGTLTLDDLGDPNAVFVFQVGSTLTTSTGSSVVTINGGPSPGSDVFWQVGSSATIGNNSAVEGHILALTSITLASGASILDGAALAINGAVTLDDNAITNAITNAVGTVPEPGSMALMLLGGVTLWAVNRPWRFSTPA